MLTKFYAILVLAEERWFRSGLAAIILAALMIWSLLAGWPFSLISATEQFNELPKVTNGSPGPTTACNDEAEANAVAEADEVIPKSAPLDSDTAQVEPTNCGTQVASSINELFRKARAGEAVTPLPSTIVPAMSRVCAVGSGGIEGLSYPSREAWLVGEGYIACSIGERMAVRTLLYRADIMAVRPAWWLTMLIGLGLLGLALLVCWRAYSTRMALIWLDESKHL